MVKVGVLIGAIICIIGGILELINFVSLEIQTLTYETLAVLVLPLLSSA